MHRFAIAVALGALALAPVAEASPKKPAPPKAKSKTKTADDPPQMKGAKCGAWKNKPDGSKSRSCTYTETVMETKGGGV
jgi:hypothetical protein